MWAPILLLALAAVVSCVIAVFSTAAKKHRLFKAGLLSLSLTCAAASCYFAVLTVDANSERSEPTQLELESVRPIAVASDNSSGESTDEDYASSASCIGCHEDQHASWHESYHRTMTQVAASISVIGNFDDQRVFAYGNEIKLKRDGERFYAVMKNSALPPPLCDTPMEHDIVMTTGSHHMQVYWYATGDGRRVGQLPVVWLKESQQWVPIDSIFIRPHQTEFGDQKWRWNLTCIKCHVTQGRPRIDVDRTPQADTHVAEFGIACEACHGPGLAHVRDHLANVVSPAEMKNPDKLMHERSAEVCGQCHSVWTSADHAEAVLAYGEGQTYRPGQTLADTRHVFGTGQRPSEHVEKYLAADPTFHEDRFWADGMVRVSGREYNGLVNSACFQSGAMSCLSCHDMHADAPDKRWANDQLKSSVNSDGASSESCLACHGEFDSPQALAAHTNHAPSSSGSVCYNCHMPHTTYGLLKAIRSHQISSPSVQETLEAGRPNACNLCHVDKSLPWTAKWLIDWYEIATPQDYSVDQRAYSAILLDALTGDAGQRALAAWTLGWKPAQEASQVDWVPGILGQLLDDPYDAVRYVAHRSLKSYPGYEDFRYNFVGNKQNRVVASATAARIWRGNSTRLEPNPRVLIGENGTFQTKLLMDLLRMRNDRVIVLAE